MNAKDRFGPWRRYLVAGNGADEDEDAAELVFRVYRIYAGLCPGVKIEVHVALSETTSDDFVARVVAIGQSSVCVLAKQEGDTPRRALRKLLERPVCAGLLAAGSVIAGGCELVTVSIPVEDCSPHYAAIRAEVEPLREALRRYREATVLEGDK